MSPPKITKPCTLCGVWTCSACGWQRHGAALARPEMQDCARCHGTEGTMQPTRHRRDTWVRCVYNHDWDAAEKAWDEAPS